MPKTSPSDLARFATPGIVVTLFVLAMSGCVLGLIIWKASEARSAALTRGETDIKNLSHSLAQQATHSIQAADIALSGMIDVLKYSDPLPDRFNPYLQKTVQSLPQLREIGVLSSEGDWKFSSLAELPRHNNSDRDYFIFHRNSPDPALRISDPIISRITGRSTIILSKRISDLEGKFRGVVLAAIDLDYFHQFYSTFNLGFQGGISLLRTDGIVLVHWPSRESGKNLSQAPLFQVHLKQRPVGYYKVVSPFDGVSKYFGYEQVSEYPLVAAVAISENELLATWRAGLSSDLIVALIMLCTVILMAALLAAQFRHRVKIEQYLREGEKRYRLLADNIADVVLLLDHDWKLIYVSQSVRTVLGYRPSQLIGNSCLDFIHPVDQSAVKFASANLARRSVSEAVAFRMTRADGRVIWLESTFKLAETTEPDGIRIVSVLRDVTQRRATEEELKSLHLRMAQLATTDSLTGLANRRAFDGFLRREFESQTRLSVLLFDIDNFKGFNDSLGHPAGDVCLAEVAKVMAGATTGTKGLSARYGGEEFVIVLPGISEDRALKFSEAIRTAVRSLNILNPAAEGGILTVSVGVASKMQFTESESLLVAEADLSLYEAKRLGRNRSVAHSSLLSDFKKAVLVPIS